MITRQELEGQWNEVKGQVKERWGQLTDEELTQARGSADQLVGVIQQRTGESRREIEDYLESTLKGGTATLHRVAEAAREYADTTAQVAREQYEHLSENVRAGYEQAQGMVQRNPVESLAVAFGAGIITGVVLGLTLRSR